MDIKKYLNRNEDIYITKKNVGSYIGKPFIVKNGVEQEMGSLKNDCYIDTFRDLYFYNDLAIADVGYWKGDDGISAYYIDSTERVLLDKDLNIVLKDGQLDKNGFARESWQALKVVTEYGLGGLQVVNPSMFSPSFKQDLDTAFDIYKTNKLKAHPELKEHLNKEQDNFKKCLEEMQKELEEESMVENN